MAVTITDPLNLNLGTEVTLNTTAKTITLNIAGNLSTAGVAGQALYSFMKMSWENNSSLIKYPFPMNAITNEQFEFINGWLPSNDATRKLIRTAGWAEYGSTGSAITRKYAGIITLGSLGTSDQVYYQQATSGTASSATNFTYQGTVNEAIQIWGDSSNGNFDYTGYLKVFVRIQGKVYAQAQISDIGVTTMSYICNRFPLANSTDSNITHTDAVISASSPYTGVSISYLSANQNVTIGTSAYPYNIIVNSTSGATISQIYEKIEYLLRQTTNVNSNSIQTGSVIGNTANTLMAFTGSTLVTTKGVYISGFNASDTNNIQFMDVNGTTRTYPYVASLTLNSNSYLQTDTSAIYRVFFTNDATGLNAGNNFGTSGAIIVNDANSNPISGYINGNSTLSFSYAYDSNIQRGPTSVSTDAPITVVAIGLSSAQYVMATGTITRSTANTVSLVASLERNFVT